jgi:high-affinity nickel permease
MIGALSIVALGFFLGMRHATDADHVVAVTTIVSRERSVKLAALIGAIWGVGHTLTIVGVGGAIILFNVVVPVRLGLMMEMAVGLMLILLGVVNVTGSVERVRKSGLVVRAHAHDHEGDGVPVGRTGIHRLIRPLTVGIVHGLAGSAAVALLVLTTIRDSAWALAYLLVFGAGTVAGMVLVTTAIAWPFVLTGRRFASTNRRLQIATGVLSLAFGFVVVYEIGYLGGLFGAHPQWTPH